jgi:very-short-patch-repair endonuclease
MGKIVSVDSKLRRDRARRLRGDQTPSETRLWEALRGSRLEGWKWRRRVPVGPFIVDFLCLDAYLRARGLQMLRFWNSEVSTDFDGVCWTILSACRETDPHQRGRRIARRL